MNDRWVRGARVAASCALALVLGVAGLAAAVECPTAVSPRPVPLVVGAEALGASRAPGLELGSFDINIVAGSTLQGNAPALAAFERAAAQWKAFISDPIVVNIDADLANLGSSSIIGQSAAVLLVASYATVRNAMVSDAALDAGDGIAASIPVAMSFLYPPLYTATGNLIATKANLKAIGFTGLDGTFGSSDGSITFNTQFSFDFDNSDGVTPGTVDFETVAAHEIGHTLGFISSVDDVDTSPFPGSVSAAPLDLYRFEDGTVNDPATTGDFATFARSQAPGVEAVFDDIASEARMSTGKVMGDGRQASHWKDDALTSVFVGLMDPTLPAGSIETVGAADLRALDLIGYDIGTVGTTTTTTATTSTTTTTIPLLCAPSPATGCRQPGIATLAIADSFDDARDALKWSWNRGAQTDVGEFKNPVSGSATYELCVYDASVNAQPLMASRIMPGGTCNGRPCWKVAGPLGYGYVNKLGSPQGIVKGKLKAGPAGRAQIKLSGKGMYLPTPAPPLTLPVTVQFMIDDGTTTDCWQTTFAYAPANTPGKFKTKASYP
jgi:hypothetical protein